MTEVKREFLLPWLLWFKPPGGCWSPAPSFRRTNAIWAGATVVNALSDREAVSDVIGIHTMGVGIIFGELDRSGQGLLSLVCEVEV